MIEKSRLDELLPVPRPSAAVGPLGRALSRVVPGVAATVAHVGEYADYWDTHNRDVLRHVGTDPWWVVMGDSTAQGVGALSARGGWVGQLDDQLRLAGRHHRLLNLSVSGARAADLIEVQLPRYEAFMAAWGTPQLTIVAIGANDSFRSVNVSALRSRLAHIAERLPQGSVMALLPVAGPAAVARLANRTVRDLCEQHGMTPADINRHAHVRRNRLASDGFHPSELGYSEWTIGLAEAVSLIDG